MTIPLFLLPERAVLKVEGKEIVDFLQGLVSNDINKISTNNQPVWSALLTPQGKFLHEFFVIPYGDAVLLDVSTTRKDDLYKRLSIYKLRSDVQIQDVNDQWHIGAILENLPLDDTTHQTEWGLLYRDPRLTKMGWRYLIHHPLPPKLSTDNLVFSYEEKTTPYHQHRIQQGVPDGDRDLPVEKAILLENGFEELQGIDWDKGCYMGQELIARTHYRGLVRKRLFPVHIQGPAPAPGDTLIVNEQKWGTMQGSEGDWGLALLYIDKVRPIIETKDSFTVGDSRLTPYKPDWLTLPKAET